jgi:AcrR family transcriptional regulator
MATKPRERIIESAARLIYADGIDTVGVHRIIAEADVAPMTLYRQFGGKDALVAAALEYWSAEWFRWLREQIGRLQRSPEAALEAFWNALEVWFRNEHFRGSLIENAATELRGRPDHPAWAVIGAHRSALHDLLGQLAKRAGSRDPSAAADQFQLLADGAVTVAMVDHRPTAAASVRELAGAVITAAAA